MRAPNPCRWWVQVGMEGDATSFFLRGPHVWPEKRARNGVDGCIAEAICEAELAAPGQPSEFKSGESNKLFGEWSLGRAYRSTAAIVTSGSGCPSDVCHQCVWRLLHVDTSVEDLWRIYTMPHSANVKATEVHICICTCRRWVRSAGAQSVDVDTVPPEMLLLNKDL